MTAGRGRIYNWMKHDSLWSVVPSFSVAVKYDYIGKVLKPGEEPTEYTDDDEGKDKKTEWRTKWRGGGGGEMRDALTLVIWHFPSAFRTFSDDSVLLSPHALQLMDQSYNVTSLPNG